MLRRRRVGEALFASYESERTKASFWAVTWRDYYRLFLGVRWSRGFFD